MAQWLVREFTDREIRDSNPTSASLVLLSKLEKYPNPRASFGWHDQDKAQVLLDELTTKCKVMLMDMQSLNTSLTTHGEAPEVLERSTSTRCTTENSLSNRFNTDSPTPSHVSYGSETTVVEHLKASQFRYLNTPSLSHTTIQPNRHVPRDSETDRFDTIVVSVQTFSYRPKRPTRCSWTIRRLRKHRPKIYRQRKFI
ncbi:hypothetical protein CLF_110238 [Clonorchis sinensis]|uniref:Uncharacterized protein n=1 Tax=Clonorchis sinensis TaxID=79923 RepID=G7YKF8_CLOSI|nr:hypothetical protein CLF_110238 [Clonorchis sinensis]